MDRSTREHLEKQQYRVVSGSGAVKLCHWMRQKLVNHRPCYKEEFYGIESHRCLQMTPVVNACNCRCLFCWRFHGMAGLKEGRCPDPEDLLDSCIREQGLLVSGFKGDPRCSEEQWEEARRPNQVAISLSGEPTLYPKLGDFIELCHRRGMTTFLVTNGTLPKAISNLSTLPTQLYVTVSAPNKKVFGELCVPQGPGAWEKLMETVALLPSLETRTVIRHTLVEGWNMGWEKEYAAIDSTAEPMFIEPKGYVFVGDSRTRMNIDNMPSHPSVKEFSIRLADILSLEVLREHEDSRVVLVGRGEDELKIRR